MIFPAFTLKDKKRYEIDPDTASAKLGLTIEVNTSNMVNFRFFILYITTRVKE